MKAIGIRIMGRGGQGIKSAAHIVGTAAFLGGNYVQDQPIYGAERRGAPVTAFVRISEQPILERGHLTSPSLLVIADDTLLADSTIDATEGITNDTSVLLNTGKSSEQVRTKFASAKAIFVAGLSDLVDRIAGKDGALSVALASTIGKMIGQDFNNLSQALDLELRNIRVQGEELRQNLLLAKQAFDLVEQVKLSESDIQSNAKPESCIELEYQDPMLSTCTIVSTGNTKLRRVGDWSNYKPMINLDECTKCMICFAYCPDSAITIESESKYPTVDYAACKGCNICFTECPTKAITMKRRENE